MELIRKSDALHAVLHNQGDAAVAAVQNIKPVETKRGKWIDTAKWDWVYKMCSVCRKGQDTASNYCPNCGCRMYGKEKDDADS